MAANAQRPTIAITTDLAVKTTSTTDQLWCQIRMTYVDAVSAAGGVPVLLPPVIALAQEHARLFDGYVFIGGDDLWFEPFGQRTHPKAENVHRDRQSYERALLDALRDHRPAAPVLGVCLGMQHMSMHAGGAMNQYLPETMPGADRHRFDNQHPIIPNAQAAKYAIVPGPVTSYHKQGVTDPGSLTVLAHSDDGLIEAVADPKRPFYLGVQWHPERTPNPALGVGIFAELVRQAHAAQSR